MIGHVYYVRVHFSRGRLSASTALIAVLVLVERDGGIFGGYLHRAIAFSFSALSRLPRDWNWNWDGYWDWNGDRGRERDGNGNGIGHLRIPKLAIACEVEEEPGCLFSDSGPATPNLFAPRFTQAEP